MNSSATSTPGSQQPLLRIQGVKTWFPIQRGVISRTVGYVRAVDGVTLDLYPGETLGLVGESGCGKTTLARTIMRLDPVHAGSIYFRGQDIANIPMRRLRPLRRQIQIIFQDPFSSLNPRQTVIDIVTEGMLAHGMINSSKKEAEAARILGEVGLDPNAMHRYPHEFSGGQRQRISVARAISMEPQIVLCDEAVSALDVSVQAQVINLLTELRARHGLSYIFISHDLSVVRHISDRIAVMYLGEVVELGRTDDIINQPSHPYTRALVSAIPRVGRSRGNRIVLGGDVPSSANPPSGCRFHPRCPYAIADCAKIHPELEAPQAHPDRLSACIRRNDI